MHETTLKLGPWKNDPRFEIVKVDGADAIRTDNHTIICRTPRQFEVWPLMDARATFPDSTERTLSNALAYVLGEPAKVGPTGMTQWLHTDGRSYDHDPATTGFRRSASLQPGMIVDWPHVEAFEITGPAQNREDDLGRWRMAFPVRRVGGGSTWWFYGDDELVPVRFRTGPR